MVHKQLQHIFQTKIKFTKIWLKIRVTDCWIFKYLQTQTKYVIANWVQHFSQIVYVIQLYFFNVSMWLCGTHNGDNTPTR